ncbi:lipid IV(A) 3-deoxy-D-manno-octulosonic acid transferase [Shewanella submarina]|uniref:3-deoxy-D-manno-octulosonic acid transferase n=1 Tax=Shewanella submarina TaxID=2016376 RepID=A0ABV7GGE8_9GAMM|nr:lipid IV(A) 3-deoxy-D-manno-octulosonic acid transferase [Shewanella submarina]MCL1038772.1 lipid IV(A) 3-deoxy-D-manno-octulosonic acid transferase [Shewanella submarina]
MNRIGYSILVTLLSPLLLLYLALRGRKSPDYKKRWGERFGMISLCPTDVLLHSVSMGETLAAVPLIRRLLSQHPELTMTITTSSPTGSAEVVKAFANELEAGRVQHCYLPFDLPVCIKRFVRQISPKVCIIMETELWPNLIHCAAGNGAKVILANGRLSAKSFAQYQKWPGISGPMLSKLDMLAVQTQTEAERYVELGVPGDKVQVCGSLKFDLQLDTQLRPTSMAMRTEWHKADVPLWVAGSIHPGEFDAVLAAHKALVTEYPHALLIMVPRHPEQFDNAAEALVASGLKFVRRSEGTPVGADTQVLLGDTMGEMLKWYGAADFAFVGGSLIVHGGHNPLEAAALGLPVMMGPNYRDFLEITEMLQQAGNLSLVQDADVLAAKVQELASSVEIRESAGKGGIEVLERNRGALQRQFALVDNYLH